MGVEKKLSSTRQELWMAMKIPFSIVIFRYGDRLAPGGSNSEQISRIVEGKENDALGTPGASTPRRRIRYCLGQSPPMSTRLSLPAAKKPTDWLSGDQKGKAAPSVSGNG